MRYKHMDMAGARTFAAQCLDFVVSQINTDRAQYITDRARAECPKDKNIVADVSRGSMRVVEVEEDRLKHGL
jgi:hypothetical protein